MKTIIVQMVTACTCLAIISCSVAGLDDYNKGVQYQHENKIDLAEQQFKLALQKNPSLAEAYLNLGRIYLQKGSLDESEANTKKALDLFLTKKSTIEKGAKWQESASIAYNNLGAVNLGRAVDAYGKSNIAKAKEYQNIASNYFKKAVELNPGNAQANDNFSKIKDLF